MQKQSFLLGVIVIVFFNQSQSFISWLLVYILASQQIRAASHCSTLPAFYFGRTSGSSTSSPIINKNAPINGTFFFMVAGVGFEPHDLQVMSLASYRTALPRVKQNFIIRHFFYFVKGFYKKTPLKREEFHTHLLSRTVERSGRNFCGS